MEVNLYKYRSITACLKASYDLMTGNFKSLLKGTWWAMLPYSIIAAVAIFFFVPNKSLHDWGINSPWSAFILQTLVYLLCIIMGVVACWSVWKWLSKSEKVSIGKALRRSVHHIGSILLILIPGGIMVCCASCLVCIPAMILVLAQTFSQLGALEGDPLGTPAYFTPLLFVVFTAGNFITAYMTAWLLISLFYLHGNHEAQDMEKKQLKIQDNETDQATLH